MAKTKLRKKNEAKGIMLNDFRLHCKAIVIKTVWYLHKNRSVEQNRELINKLMHYGQLIYNKGGKNIQWR